MSCLNGKLFTHPQQIDEAFCINPRGRRLHLTFPLRELIVNVLGKVIKIIAIWLRFC